MTIAGILSASRTHCDTDALSKKRALEHVADFICQDMPDLDASALFKNLINRERLGSTGIGEGIAIPHCRMSNCPNITGALVRLAEPVDFDALDDEPVDLLFTLLVPEEACDEHLQVLGNLAKLFSNPDFRDALRNASNDQELYEAAVNFDPEPERNAQQQGQRQNG